MVTITATLPDGTKQTLDVDAIVTEGFSDTATITDFPREVGPDVSDNIRPEPESLKLDLVISNTPFGATGREQAGLLPDLAEQGFRTLLYWRNAGALLSLDTTMGPRASMAIHAVSMTRDAKTGGQPGHTGGARIALDLKEIVVVQNKLISITVTKDKRGAKTAKTGNQPVVDIEPTSGLISGYNEGKRLYSGMGKP